MVLVTAPALISFALLLQAAGAEAAGAAAASRTATAHADIPNSIIVTQAPVRRTSGPFPGIGSRLVLVQRGGVEALTHEFHSAADPEVSFDARTLLFAAKRGPSDAWNVFEMDLGTRQVRQITRDLGDCRNPIYQGLLFTLDSPQPWRQVAFLASGAGSAIPGIYSAKLDGSEVSRLTHTPFPDAGLATLPDGRMLFSHAHDPALAGPARESLFAVNIDGTDYAIFSGSDGRRRKMMPAVTPARLVVFVETGDEASPDGGGTLGSLSLRRNLGSYRPITQPEDGLFHSPSALADGRVLVSRRTAGARETYGVFRLDPMNAEIEPVFDDPAWHDVQARVVAPRPQPDGRSTVVQEKDANGILYGLNVYQSRLAPEWVKPGTALRLRVVEGVPGGEQPGAGAGSRATKALRRRLLGDVPVADDGSFNVQVPANTPVQLQLVDAGGLAVRTSEWIWVRNHAAQGCVGCHEDPEIAPANKFAKALTSPSMRLTLPPEKRRTVEFRRDVLPVIQAKCATAACHGVGSALPFLPRKSRSAEADARSVWNALLAPGAGGTAKYVQPGAARTSPLIWRLFGRNTSRPWDARAADAGAPAAMPPAGTPPLTAAERQTLIEWIDLGAEYGEAGAASRTRTRGEK